MSTTNFTQLRDQIDQTFNEEEVRSLCTDIGVDYDNLGGRGKAANVRELLAHCQRHDLLPDLQAVLEAERPHINWRALISPLFLSRSPLHPLTSAPLPLHQIPFHRNPNFTGRVELLEHLQSKVVNRQAVPTAKIVIAGLGGMGKTQLVLEYCYRHLDEYGLIYWLNADDVPAVNEGLAGLAYELGLMRREAGDPEAAVQAALRWLAQMEDRWLLVYDNADRIEPQALLPLLPKLGNGACLITSRNANWQAITGAEGLLRLDVFTEAEAVAFLWERLGREEDSGESEVERDLVDELGYFPLALEHAAAYMVAHGRGVADYLALYQRRRQDLWQRAEIRQDYQKTITTTWELAFEQARQTPGAMALLNFCCFLDGDWIPLALLTEHADKLPEELATCVADELDLDDAIIALSRYSLLRRERRQLTLHRLVQVVGRDRMGVEHCKKWLASAVVVTRAVLNFESNEVYASEHMVLQARAVAVLSIEYQLITEQAAVLYNQIGFYLTKMGQLTAAFPFFQRALDIREKVLGLDHLNTTTSLNNMGWFLNIMGRHKEAQPFFQRALDVREVVLGTDHPKTAVSLNNMGRVLLALKQPEEALSFVQRALDIQEKVLEADSPDTADSLNTMGRVLLALRQPEEAKLFFQRALDICEKALGSNHPDTADSLHNISYVLLAMEQPEKAQPFIQRALDIREKTLSTNKHVMRGKPR